jgi:ribosome biogenesis GTPase
LCGITAREVIECFPEFVAATPSECHFRDCTHLHEPGCNIRDAVNDGRITSSRYEGYGRIMAELQGEQ